MRLIRLSGLHRVGTQEMTFDFDQVIDRWDTNAIAADAFRDYLLDDYNDLVMPCHDRDAISMWVADMAFAVPPTVVEAMRRRLDHPIFGYSVLADDNFYSAYADWCDDRYSWRPDPDHFSVTPGVVPALFSLVEYFIAPGEKVVTLTPAYSFFKTAVDDQGRGFVSCSLDRDEEGNYTIDFEAFQRVIADPAVKMFFLCHPHNPTGRVWTDAELIRMTEICLEHDVVVVSDEIHCDVLRVGLSHTPLAKLFPESDRIITCMSSSKTFNLAGLGISQIVIPGDELREIWSDRASPVINPISEAGAIAALRTGEPWRQALLAYLDANFEYLDKTLQSELPDAGFTIPDATYLGWIDLGRYFPPETDLTRHFAEKAGVLVEGGDLFVADGAGHFRINIACPRSTLTAGLERIIAATVG